MSVPRMFAGMQSCRSPFFSPSLRERVGVRLENYALLLAVVPLTLSVSREGRDDAMVSVGV